VSLKRFIDGHEHNKDTLGHEQCMEQRYSLLCVLKCQNKWNGEKIQLILFISCCKGQVDSVYFRFIDINRTKR